MQVMKIGGGIRPTSSKVRQAIFNMLGSISNKTFLDLFCGTGEVGFDALNQGAAHIGLVDKDTFYIKKNNKNYDFEKITLIKGFLPGAIKKITKPYDIIFVDPPFTQEVLLEETLNLLIQSPSIFTENSTLVVQQSSRYKIKQRKGLHILKEKNYGESKVLFYQKEKSL